MPRFNPGDIVVFIGDTRNADSSINRSDSYTVGRTYVVRRWNEGDSIAGFNSLYTMRDDRGSASNGWRDYYFAPLSEISCAAKRRKLGVPNA